MIKENMDRIVKVIENYFHGVYTGNIELLKSAFHKNSNLYGDIKGIPYEKTLADYLDGVANRQSPQALGEDFKMEIISIETLNSIAYVKVRLPMLGFNYYDFLALNQIDDKWVIVNKIFTHIE